MDLVAACRVFVHVGERGSFTLGAATARVPQSVASRRIAALEQHFGERLFDRSARRAALTVFGRDMLPSAKRLVQLADALQDQAEQAKLRPLVLAVPDTCSVRRLALLEAAARAQGTILDFRAAGPAERAELLLSSEVRVALVTVPPDEAAWVVPLGVASAANRTGASATSATLTGADAGTAGTGAAGARTSADAGPRPLRIETLRPRRGQRSFTRIWIQPEDDVPQIRDRMEQISHRTALVPAQIAVAASLTAAVSDVLRTGNLLLCSPVQAEELGLHWRPLAGAPVARGFTAAAATREDAQRLRDGLRTQVAYCLGAPVDSPEGQTHGRGR
ncbi:LysR family transcriptional regulator [Rugosimonospora africana]|uniref:LysR family transcriptional regulator n=1 Tax=Rugosimonospora africana TaxID=556532 RepID=A0A8J3QYY7_9ACTN|nr:LysR family transcriptional regulator [Rugosimonospora africana]GIH18458.1 LysR family transcriptional regulator [Rugosimonospora africana]